MRRAVAGLALTVALAAACGQPAAPAGGVNIAPTLAPTTSAPATPPPERHVPTRLQIPAIGVDAKVESLGVTRGSDSGLSMAVPGDPADVGWYSPGSAPTEAGDVVFDGHLDWTSGPAVFWRLASVPVGAMVVIADGDGVKFAYRVTSNTTVARDAHPADLFATTGDPRVSLITCTGRFDGRQYVQRRIVTAVPA